MTLKIGEKIKTLRKKANATQEKFAEYLGVTFQAVSRWESGVCYPDIEIVPSIANFFNITTDELLGVDIMNKQERIEEIQKQLREKSSKGLADEYIDICRIALNEFPNEYKLLYNLSYYLGRREETRKEAISIQERILADCTEDFIRYDTMRELAQNYKETDNKEKAIEIAKKLPYFPVTCDRLLTDILDGDAKIVQLRNNIIFLCDWLTIDIKNYGHAKFEDDKNTDSVKKRIQLCKKALDIFAIVYEDGDYGLHSMRIRDLYLNMAANYMLLSDFDNALDCVEKAADYAIAFDMAESFKHTSIFIEPWEFSKGNNLIQDKAYNKSYDMLYNRLSDERYNPIRESERFKAVVAKLEQYASEE